MSLVCTHSSKMADAAKRSLISKVPRANSSPKVWGSLRKGVVGASCEVVRESKLGEGTQCYIETGSRWLLCCSLRPHLDNPNRHRVMPTSSTHRDKKSARPLHSDTRGRANPSQRCPVVAGHSRDSHSYRRQMRASRFHQRGRSLQP